MPASTDKNNNTSPTAASASTDLNGTAALRAAEILEGAARRDGGTITSHRSSRGIEPLADAHPLRRSRRVRHRAGRASDSSSTSSFNWPMKIASTWARGASTPRRGSTSIATTGRGNPFLYFTNGAAVSEVDDRSADRRAHGDTGRYLDRPRRSLNPAIDRGQVIGGFVQGMGWVTTEELLYSETGELLSHSPNNYKIPSVECLPRSFSGRTSWRTPTIRSNLLGSKAVGEPPFVLGLSCPRGRPVTHFRAWRRAAAPPLSLPGDESRNCCNTSLSMTRRAGSTTTSSPSRQRRQQRRPISVPEPKS